MNAKGFSGLNHTTHYWEIRSTYLPLFIFLITIICFTTIGIAQEQEVTIDKAEQNEIISKISDILNKNYVYPETAKKMSTYITEKLNKGEYDALTSPQEFANQLTEDLREISKDKHIEVEYDPETVKLIRKSEEDKDDTELLKRRLKRLRRINFGFKEVKILDGNVGYMDLRQFEYPKYAGETAVAAMNFLANCDALIIDLRRNGGGGDSMIQLIASYFIDDEVHLHNFYWRPTDKTFQTRTLSYVPGKRMPDIDIYVLTSKQTFSAAEAFCYDLKHLKRATLIGETTGGGAHAVGRTEVINDNFYINVPKGRAINPITKTNWEGVGVKPHIDVPQQDALTSAHLKALEKLAANTKDEDDIFTYNWYIESLKIELNPFQIESSILQSYAGKYGPRTIMFENGELYYQLEGRPKYRMIPMSDELFMFKEIPYYRIKFIMENGHVKTLIGLYDDGSTITLFPK